MGHFSPDPAELTIAVIDTFQATEGQAAVDALPASRKIRFNTDLSSAGRGVFIGRSGNYNLFVQEWGASAGEITPYIGIAGGVWHPMVIRRVVHVAGTHETSAPCVLVGQGN